MLERRKLKIFDQMIKANSILVGLSLLLLVAFIIYVTDGLSFKTWLMTKALFNDYLIFLDTFNYVVVILITLPLFGAVFELFFGEKFANRRDKSVIYMGFLEILLIILLYPKVSEEIILLEFPGFMGLGISFRIDMLAYSVLLISSFIWFYVMIYAHEYMKKEHKRTRFFFFLALTYSSVLGTIVSGDLLAMFMFFEIMTITSYMLVIHEQNEESYKAGYNFIIMGLIGGLLILTALILLYFYIGDLRFASAINELQSLGNLKYWIMGLLVFGFGIKAGMAPVHVWLPRAHPVAPSPASALLSGVLIKIGAYGILRVAVSYYFPTRSEITTVTDPIWQVAGNVGAIIIWTGILTMAIGAFMALVQDNIKKLLAYSSVSQMGYILVGIGVALFLGYEGAMGYSGAIYHIINHALFKSLLFMVAGVIYFHTKELNMHKLGGIWKKLPFTTLIFLIATFGIIGFPLFNGYVSKTIIHHGLSEAAHLNSLFYLAEAIFIIISCLTVSYFAKMFYYVFLKKSDNEYKDLVFDISSLDLALGSIALLIVGIGVFPNFVLDSLILPQLQMTTYDPHFISQEIASLSVFSFKDIATSMGIIIFGIFIFLIGNRYRFFNIKLPRWLSIEYWFFLPTYLLMQNLCRIMYGSSCNIKVTDYDKLAIDDTHNFGFIDRFVITTKALNERYEQTLIRSDALIYAFFITATLIFMLLKVL